jgi:hypothetical protein
MAKKVLKDGTVVTLTTIVCAKCRNHTALLDTVEGKGSLLYCQDCADSFSRPKRAKVRPDENQE